MENKFKPVNIALCAIGMLLFAVYALAIFLFSGLFTANAVVSFLFAVIAFVCAFALPRFAAKDPSIEAVFFGIPMMGFGVYYFFAELFVSVVFIAFQQVIPFSIVLFLQVALLIAFLVISIVSFTAQRASAKQSEERREDVAAWNIQTVDVQSLVDVCRANGADASLSNALAHLAETIRYSDPFSGAHPAIKEVESRIAGKLFDLQGACTSGDYVTAAQLVKELEMLYSERSRKMLLVK